MTRQSRLRRLLTCFMKNDTGNTMTCGFIECVFHKVSGYMRNTLYLTWFIMSPRWCGVNGASPDVLCRPGRGVQGTILEVTSPPRSGGCGMFIVMSPMEWVIMECIKTNYVALKVGVIRYGTGWLWRPPASGLKVRYLLLLCRPWMEGC